MRRACLWLSGQKVLHEKGLPGMKKFFHHLQASPVAESENQALVDTIPPRRPGHGLLRGFLALRQRNFRLFWCGQLISLLGSWMQSIGQTWLVLELTHSAWQLGLVGALQALPILFFSLFGGVFADRWPKRQVLFVTQTAALLQAFLLWALLVSGTLQLWHLYLLALLLGITNSLELPTRRAFVVELVGREDLPNAIALNSSITTLARIVGPGMGGLVIAASGVTSLFLLNALSFLPVLASLLLIQGHQLHARELPPGGVQARQSTWQSLREGINYVWRTPAVLLVILVVGMTLLFGSNFNVLLPLFATDVLLRGATGYGFLSAALGAGAFLATLWLAWGNQKPTLRHLLTVMLFLEDWRRFSRSRIAFFSRCC